MNSRILHLICAFAAGVGITLAVRGIGESKSKPSPSTASAGESRISKSAPLRSSGLPDSPASSNMGMGSNKKKSQKPPKSEEEKEKDKLDKARKREEWRQRFVENSRKKAEEKNAIQLNYLAEVLGLSPDQVARLEADLAADLEKRLQETEDKGVGGLWLGKDTQADFLGELLEGIMTPAQQEAYAALQEKERAHTVESRTMKRFADLPVALNLSEAQRDQVFDILAAEELESLDAPPKPPKEKMKIFTRFVSGDGGEVLSYSTSGSKSKSKEEADRRMEQRRQEIDRRVETLGPILNDRQLDVYKDHLDKRGRILSTGTTLSFDESKLSFEVNTKH